jgi:hypothetical protein
MVIEASRALGRVTVTTSTLLVREGRASRAAVQRQPFDAAGDLTLRAARPFAMTANATGTCR